MNDKLKYALAACGLITASSAVLADKQWEEKDANKDGRISRAEYITAAEENFSRMDTNNDSVLSQSEFEKGMEYKKDKHKKKDT